MCLVIVINNNVHRAHTTTSILAGLSLNALKKYAILVVRQEDK